jgi:hypothetical protein
MAAREVDVVLTATDEGALVDAAAWVVAELTGRA